MTEAQILLLDKQEAAPPPALPGPQKTRLPAALMWRLAASKDGAVRMED